MADEFDALIQPITPAKLRDRMLGIGKEAPDQLLAHPRNPKIHARFQQKAIAASLEELGWLGFIMVNQSTQHVLDGHARVNYALSQGEPWVPVVYVDLTEAEEDKVLALFDPIGTLFSTDPIAEAALLANIQSDSPELTELIERMKKKAEGYDPDPPGDGEPGSAGPTTAFRFGKYKARLSQDLYDQFKARYEAVADEGGTMEDVFRHWLNL